jgi:prevent-host-death family protein
MNAFLHLRPRDILPVDPTLYILYSSSKRTIQFAAMLKTSKTENVIVSALRARTNFGALLRQIEDEHRSLVIEKRGTPRAVLLSIRHYVRLAAPEPDVLKAIGEDSKGKGTSALTSRQIDQLIKKARARKAKR